MTEVKLSSTLCWN